MTKIRKSRAPAPLSRIQFHDRFTQSFKDPLFAPEAALARVEAVAWKAYEDSRQAPVTQGIEGVRRALSDWLDWMGLVDAGPKARLDRYIGYYEPYATSHDALDRDRDVQEEVRNVARAVITAVREARAGRLSMPDAKLESARPK